MLTEIRAFADLCTVCADVLNALVCWALENRGAMLRVIGGTGDPASRIENRVGEPTANPYLYIASQLIAGRAGIAENADPGEAVRAAYLSDRPLLPSNLLEALSAFKMSDRLHDELGGSFHNYFCMLKQFEINRFMSEVTDWEEREYFEMY
ncbi:hypothetical protein [uncultured Roseobacter sp.]|uniref:hypothetical protein n=1 Tax=uncultured Roseobacter sp. TaxID=114847 RepID=UPI00345DFC6E